MFGTVSTQFDFFFMIFRNDPCFFTIIFPTSKHEKTLSILGTLGRVEQSIFILENSENMHQNT